MKLAIENRKEASRFQKWAPEELVFFCEVINTPHQEPDEFGGTIEILLRSLRIIAVYVPEPQYLDAPSINFEY